MKETEMNIYQSSQQFKTLDGNEDSPTIHVNKEGLATNRESNQSQVDLSKVYLERITESRLEEGKYIE